MNSKVHHPDNIHQAIYAYGHNICSMMRKISNKVGFYVFFAVLLFGCLSLGKDRRSWPGLSLPRDY